MTRKDYVELAKAIRINTSNDFFTGDFEKYMGNKLNPIIFRDDFISDLCSILKADNPRFDKERFMIACDSPD